MSLSPQQIKHLRSLAHHLKPVVMVGQQGLKESIFDEVEIALDAHELIKVRIAAERDERQQIGGQIAERCNAELVQRIGQMTVLFRRNKKTPRISLPAG